MLDVHNQNISFFSPQVSSISSPQILLRRKIRRSTDPLQPYFIGAFFFPQQLFQLAWLYRLWKLDAKKPSERRELDTIVDFVPYYAIGNFCIAIWMLFWNSSNLKGAHIFVTINTLTQLYYVAAKIPTMDTSSTSSILTHIVSKTFAGIGVLDLLHNGSVAFFNHQITPSLLTKVLTGVGFGLASASSDWILGGCMVYDLVALTVGQIQQGDTSWGQLLGLYAVGSAAIVGLKNWTR